MKASLSRLITTPISTWIWFIITIVAIAVFTTLGPAEHSLGTHIRIVYLHGAWYGQHWLRSLFQAYAARSGYYPVNKPSTVGQVHSAEQG